MIVAFVNCIYLCLEDIPGVWLTMDSDRQFADHEYGSKEWRLQSSHYWWVPLRNQPLWRSKNCLWLFGFLSRPLGEQNTSWRRSFISAQVRLFQDVSIATGTLAARLWRLQSEQELLGR